MDELRSDPEIVPNGTMNGDIFEHLGEVVSIGETLVVSPSPGRFRREPLVEGEALQAGTVIGSVAFNGSVSRPVTAPSGGVFLGWLAWEGESLVRGTPLARIGPSENGASNGHASDGGKGSPR